MILLVEERLSELEKKSDKFATEQEVKTEGAITRNIFTVAGIAKLVWITNPNTCDICQKLDGKVVGIEQVFIGESNQIFDFTAGGAKIHLPSHDSCECSIGLA